MFWHVYLECRRVSDPKLTTDAVSVTWKLNWSIVITSQTQTNLITASYSNNAKMISLIVRTDCYYGNYTGTTSTAKTNIRWRCGGNFPTYLLLASLFPAAAFWVPRCHSSVWHSPASVSFLLWHWPGPLHQEKSCVTSQHWNFSVPQE